MKKPLARKRIEIRLRNINQLFNTMDPSPFHEKDLDSDAEEFIVSSAQEQHLQQPLELIVHLDEEPSEPGCADVVERAIRHYFKYREDMERFTLRRLLREARVSLIIGTVFLVSCLLLAQVLARRAPETFVRILSESLTICGWVAMWRPLQMYLYDWWPIRRRRRVFQKLSRMPVIVRYRRTVGGGDVNEKGPKTIVSEPSHRLRPTGVEPAQFRG